MLHHWWRIRVLPEGFSKHLKKIKDELIKDGSLHDGKLAAKAILITRGRDNGSLRALYLNCTDGIINAYKYVL